MPYLKVYGMRLALQEALKARGRTFPNPLVGAVVVKSGRIVGKGYHCRAGGPHAEVIALKQAGDRARGATLFCTLEPCAHYGRTPPCVDRIVDSGIREVCVGMVDPNPLTKGRGLRRLRSEGIRVRVGVLEKEVRGINEPFIRAMTLGRPLVTVKLAQSIDGKIATAAGESKWITSARARAFSHRLRRFYDAIVVGVHTVRKDDPQLEPADRGHRWTKVILDSSLQTPLNARLLKTGQPVLIAAARKNADRERALRRKGAQIFYAAGQGGRVDLGRLLRELHRREIRNVLVEGGAEAAGAFLDRRLADRALFFIAPLIIGGRNALSSVGGQGIRRISQAIHLRDVGIEKVGRDLLIQGRLEYSK